MYFVYVRHPFFLPSSWPNTKHKTVGHSTVEAETIYADHALGIEGWLPFHYRRSYWTEGFFLLGDLHHTADDDDGLPVDTSALVMLDKATGWIVVYPKALKPTLPITEAMQRFDGPTGKIKTLQVAPCHGYDGDASDNWRRRPGRKDGERKWSLRNRTIRLFLNVVADIFGAFLSPQVINNVDGDSPYNKRLARNEFKGVRIPFGALIDFMPQP